MKKYHVTYNINALLEFNIEAENPASAIDLAHDYCNNANFGEITNVLSGNIQDIGEIESHEDLAEEVNKIVDEYKKVMDSDKVDPYQLCTGEWLDWFIALAARILRSVRGGSVNLNKQMYDKLQELLYECLNAPDDMSDEAWREDDNWVYDFYKLMKQIKSEFDLEKEETK